jgi:hypothetical protein
MAVISDVLAKGYFDDSQSTGEVWALGGYMGNPLHWESFDTYWPMALTNAEVPYFHMREMADPNGIFAKWLPHEEHREEVANFFSDLAKVISHSMLTGREIARPDIIAKARAGSACPAPSHQRRQLGATCHVPSRDRTNPYDAATAGLLNISGW